MNHFVKWIVLICLWFGPGAQAGQFFEEKGVALARLDALTYFSHEQRLMYGDSQKSFTFKGAKFYFVTNAHREAFTADPEHFAPQFGGYCAYGAAHGRRAPANPRVFAIQDGRLYLFADRESLSSWREDITVNVRKAETAWPALEGSADRRLGDAK